MLSDKPEITDLDLSARACRVDGMPAVIEFMFDYDGDNTDDPAECVAAAAYVPAEQAWASFAVFERERPQ